MQQIVVKASAEVPLVGLAHADFVARVVAPSVGMAAREHKSVLSESGLPASDLPLEPVLVEALVEALVRDGPVLHILKASSALVGMQVQWAEYKDNAQIEVLHAALAEE